MVGHTRQFSQLSDDSEVSSSVGVFANQRYGDCLNKIGTPNECFVCYLDQVLLDQNREARNVELSSYLGTKSKSQSITEQPSGARHPESTLDSIGWLRL